MNCQCDQLKLYEGRTIFRGEPILAVIDRQPILYFCPKCGQIWLKHPDEDNLYRHVLYVEK